MSISKRVRGIEDAVHAMSNTCATGCLAVTLDFAFSTAYAGMGWFDGDV